MTRHPAKPRESNCKIHICNSSLLRMLKTIIFLVLHRGRDGPHQERPGEAGPGAGQDILRLQHPLPG